MIQIESNGLAIALGRFDQYMYPFYRQDMDSGRLTRDEALNLLGSFFCKLSEINKIYSNEGARLLAGPAHGQALTLGGILAAGEEGTNELTSAWRPILQSALSSPIWHSASTILPPRISFSNLGRSPVRDWVSIRYSVTGW